MNARNLHLRSRITGRLATGRLASGFTLIELAVAGVVIAIGLLSFASVLISARNLDRMTAEKTIAMNLTRYCTEEVANIKDFDYIDDELAAGWCFEVEGLNPPDPAKKFADGSYPYHVVSQPLADYGEYAQHGGGGYGGGGGEVDPYMDPTLDNKGLGLVPSTDPATTAYGCITVNVDDPNMYRITTTLEWLSITGNRKVSLVRYLIRDGDDRVPTVQ